MSSDSRMTIRLEPAVRRKLERFAARHGISLNQALNRLLNLAPEEEPTKGRRRYRIKPRKVGFGFDIANSRKLAQQQADDLALEKLKRRP